MTLLELENVGKSRDGYSLTIRHFHVKAGEFVAVTGESGCGKSTLLDMLAMLLRPDADAADGTSPAAFRFFPKGKEGNAVDVKALWQHDRQDEMARIRRLNMGYVLQTGDLLPFLSVEENILLAMQLAEKSEEEGRAKADELLEQLGLTHRRHAMPATLSVGERQRAAICRALAPSPDIVLADEPTAALDPPKAHEVMRLFGDIAQKRGVAIVMVSHDRTLLETFSRTFAIRNVDMAVHAEGGKTTVEVEDRSTDGRRGAL